MCYMFWNLRFAQRFVFWNYFLRKILLSFIYYIRFTRLLENIVVDVISIDVNVYYDI